MFYIGTEFGSMECQDPKKYRRERGTTLFGEGLFGRSGASTSSIVLEDLANYLAEKRNIGKVDSRLVVVLPSLVMRGDEHTGV